MRLSLVLIFCCLSAQASQQVLPDHQAVLNSVIADYNQYCQNEVCKKQLKKLKRYARWNDSKAQLILGTARLYGDGVKQDTDKAIYWLTRAANNPSGVKYGQKAQHMLVSIYEKGIGVPIDVDKASKLRHELARKNYSPVLYKQAQQSISDGDVTLATKLLKQASDNGFRKASYQLAKIHLAEGTEDKDLLAASEYLKKLAPYDFKDSRALLAKIATELRNNASSDNASVKAIEQVLDMEVITVNGNQMEALDPMSLTLARFKRNGGKYRAATGSRIKGVSCGQTAYSCSGMSEEDLQEANDEGGVSTESEDNQ